MPQGYVTTCSEGYGEGGGVCLPVDLFNLLYVSTKRESVNKQEIKQIQNKENQTRKKKGTFASPLLTPSSGTHCVQAWHKPSTTVVRSCLEREASGRGVSRKAVGGEKGRCVREDIPCGRERVSTSGG